MHPADSGVVTSGKSLEHKANTLLGKFMQIITNMTGGTLRFDTFQPDILLEDGDRLDQYGLKARVIHTPGHNEWLNCHIDRSRITVRAEIHFPIAEARELHLFFRLYYN